MLTKSDLSQIKNVVRETIQPEIKALKKSMATKEDMRILETGLKDEMKSLETGLKDEMKSLEKRLIERIDEAQMEIIATVDKHKADKVNVGILEKRVDRLENNAGLPPYSNQ